MEESDILRFPEEREREERLRGMTAEALCSALSRLEASLPTAPDTAAEDERRQAVKILSVLERETARFLAAERGKTDVFGHLRDAGGFYADYCEMQAALQEGTQRLAELFHREPNGQAVDRYTEWAVLRLSQGLHEDPAVTDAARALLGRLREVQNRQAKEAERTAQLRACLRTFLRETIPAYCERALPLSDARNGGKAPQAGQLLALVGELNDAIVRTRRALESV
ncbi:MAG TPA: hypothetical protein DDW30_07455 [Clostridiales bacterium]|nr:hypothetical protein [Clostridiales bacterium]